MMSLWNCDVTEGTAISHVSLMSVHIAEGLWPHGCTEFHCGVLMTETVLKKAKFVMSQGALTSHVTCRLAQSFKFCLTQRGLMTAILC